MNRKVSDHRVVVVMLIEMIKTSMDKGSCGGILPDIWFSKLPVSETSRERKEGR